MQKSIETQIAQMTSVAIEKPVDILLSKAPEVVITIAITALVGFVLREYTKLRQETAQSVENIVNAKLGNIIGNFTSSIARFELLSKEQEKKVGFIESRFSSFEENINEKEKKINILFEEATKKINELRDKVPDVGEYSARDILTLAQSNDNSVSKAELCTQILEHADATAKELELAGDMMRVGNRFKLALNLYKTSQAKDPERISAKVELLCLVARVDYREREEKIENVTELVLENPNINSFDRLASLFVDLDRYQQLLVLCDNFLLVIGNRTPLRVAALRSKAFALAQLGQIEHSLETYNQAFSLDPNNEDVLRPYLSLLEEQGKNAEYLTISRRLIDLDPTYFNYYDYYIRALIKDRLFAQAQEWIERVDNLDIQKSQYNEYNLKKYLLRVESAKRLELSAKDFDLADVAQC